MTRTMIWPIDAHNLLCYSWASSAPVTTARRQPRAYRTGTTRRRASMTRVLTKLLQVIHPVHAQLLRGGAYGDLRRGGRRRWDGPGENPCSRSCAPFSENPGYATIWYDDAAGRLDALNLDEAAARR